MSKSNSSSSGVCFTSLLLLAFIVLKLCKVIDWSWWLVLSPFWITACIAFIALAVYIVLKKKTKKTYKRKLEERIEEMRNSKKNNN